MLKKKLAVLGVAAVATTLSGVLDASPGFASPAPAHTASVANPASCQAPAATAILFLTSGNGLGYDCAGTYHLKAAGTRFDAGGWSGYIVYNGGHTRRNFCNWNSFQVSGTVTTVYLSPTKESWC